MTFFGKTLDGQQLFALVSMLMMLVFWVMVLGRERNYARWFKQWEAGRKARRDAEIAAERNDSRKGPWG